MGNKITEKYFIQANFADQAQRVLAEIKARTNFQPEKEIFRGQIYDPDKVGSLIYKGVWRKLPAVLKIQGLKPEIDEIDMISRFNEQNDSKKIRLPKLYKGSKWNELDGYGYLLLEYIDAPKIYQPPLADQEQKEDFCRFYQEYKTKCLRQPLFARQPHEKNSLVFVNQRVLHWQKIAEAKEQLTEVNKKRVEKFLNIAGRHLPSIKMEFMHGHLTYNDLYKISDNEYVLMSNLFWSYRPEFYDSTFHLWAGLNSLHNKNIKLEQIIEYLQNWFGQYKKIPVIKQANDFNGKFNLMMAERCLGALLIDIKNKHQQKGQNNLVNYLSRLFADLFEYFTDKLENQ